MTSNCDYKMAQFFLCIVRDENMASTKINIVSDFIILPPLRIYKLKIQQWRIKLMQQYSAKSSGRQSRLIIYANLKCRNMPTHLSSTTFQCALHAPVNKYFSCLRQMCTLIRPELARPQTQRKVSHYMSVK